MNQYLKDVLAQPDSIRAALDFYESEGYPAKMKRLANAGCDKVVFAGMGSSHYSSFGAAIHLVSRGVNAVVKSAGEILHYERDCIDERTLLVLVSQSGESAEIVKFLEDSRCKAKIVAITNEAASTLGKRGDPTFLLHVEPEQSVSTRTYLASLVLTSMLSRAISDGLDADFTRAVHRGVDLLERLLAAQEKIGGDMKALMPNPAYTWFLGRGYSYSTMYGGALFTSELAKHPAMALDAGEFRHGPFEMVDEGYGALVFAPEGPSWEANCRMAYDITTHGGGAILATNHRPAERRKNLLVVEYGSIDEPLSPLVDIGAAEIFANMVTESKGLEVGKFRWGSKVTTVI